MAEKLISTIAREVVQNFSYYAALAEAGTEVIITRRGRVSLRLVLAGGKDRADAVHRALALRSKKPFQSKFNRNDAYEQ